MGQYLLCLIVILNSSFALQGSELKKALSKALLFIHTVNVSVDDKPIKVFREERKIVCKGLIKAHITYFYSTRHSGAKFFVSHNAQAHHFLGTPFSYFLHLIDEELEKKEYVDISIDNTTTWRFQRERVLGCAHGITQLIGRSQ